MSRSRNISLAKIHLLSFPNLTYQTTQTGTLAFSRFSRSYLSAMQEQRQALAPRLRCISSMMRAFGIGSTSSKLFEKVSYEF
jgi:hypothetical protein